MSRLRADTMPAVTEPETERFDCDHPFAEPQLVGTLKQRFQRPIRLDPEQAISVSDRLSTQL
jgi:hypothetical protein